MDIVDHVDDVDGRSTRSTLSTGSSKPHPIETDGDLDADDGDVEEPPVEPLFAFAIVTDTHVTGPGDPADRLSAAVAWLNAHTDEMQIEVVLVLGDIAWGGGLELARDLLDGLDVPYVPIIGDNEVVGGDEEAFLATFSEQYDLLADELSGWQAATAPVWDPEAERESWFTNLAFEHHAVSFVGLDWNARGVEGLGSEMGDLHDFEGGTWQWFEGMFEALPTDRVESIVMFSHIPMHVLAFSGAEMRTINGLLGPSRDAVYADFAGHVHFTYETPVPGGGYVVYVTDATNEDENTVRVVHVEGNGVRFAYTHELIVVE